MPTPPVPVSSAHTLASAPAAKSDAGPRAAVEAPEPSVAIDQLWVYPVKSCAGVALREATLTEAGLALDRACMVVDAQDRFVTQREHPRMVLIQPDISTPALQLFAPGMPALRLEPQAPQTPQTPQMSAFQRRTVGVWKDRVPAWDMGDAAAAWFSRFLGCAGLRLVRFDERHRRWSSLDWTGGVHAPNQFSDGYPLLLTTTCALDALNGQLQAQGQPGVTLVRMRPNLVVRGLPAHDEDHWVRLHCASTEAGGEDVLLQPVKPCARCPIPDIDPATAESTPHVGQALQAYRQDARLNGAPSFGMNAIVRQGAGQLLRVGQPVQVDYGFDPA